MKKVVNFADFLVAKNGVAKILCRNRVGVLWNNGKYQTLLNRSHLKERLDDGSLRFRFLR